MNTTCCNNICFSFCFCPIIISQGSPDTEIPTLPTKKKAVLEAANRSNEHRRREPLGDPGARSPGKKFKICASNMPFPAFWDHKWTQTLHKVEAIQRIATRAFHNLFEIFQKVPLNFSKSCSTVARKNQTFFWSDAKTCKLYNKSKISKHSSSVQFCGVTSVAK